MKKILIILCAVFICGVSIAQTIRWHIGDTVYETTTCNAGESITPPTAPNRFGYHLKEWEVLYTQIEYLESTGTQYIDTGVYPNDNSGFDIGYVIPDFYYTWQTMFGSRSGDNNREFAFGYYYTSGSIKKTAYGDNRITFGLVKAQYSEVSFKKNVVIKPDGSFVTMNSTGDFTNNDSIYIFALHSGGIAEYSRLKLYYLQIYDNDTLVRDGDIGLTGYPLSDHHIRYGNETESEE